MRLAECSEQTRYEKNIQSKRKNLTLNTEAITVTWNSSMELWLSVSSLCLNSLQCLAFGDFLNIPTVEGPRRQSSLSRFLIGCGNTPSISSCLWLAVS